MSTEKDLLEELWARLRALVAPLTAVGGSQARRQELAARLGWDLAALGAAAGVDLAVVESQWDAWTSAVSSAVDAVEAALAEGLTDSLGELRDRGALARTAVTALRELPAPWRAEVDPGLLARLGEDLLNHLTDRYLAGHAPVLRRVLVLLGVLTPAEEADLATPEPDTGAAVRLPARRPEPRPEALGALLRDPVAALRAEYGWTEESTVDQLGAVLLPRLAAFLRELGLDVVTGMAPGAVDAGGLAGELASTMLTVRGATGLGPARAEWGVSIALSAAQQGGLGLVVVPHGDLAIDASVGGWNVAAALSGDGVAFAVDSDGLVVDGDGVDGIELDLTATRRTVAGRPAVRIGPEKGTRLEIGELVLRAFADLRADGDHDYGLGAEAADAALVVAAAGDADSFLARILPAGGLRVPLAAALAWSRRRGLSLAGGAGLAVSVPLALDLGPVAVAALHLALRVAAGDRGLRAEATADVRFALGPVTGTVDRLGVRADLTFPDGGGNLGPADLGLALAPPKGIALRLDSGAVTGAGFLAFDPEQGRYAGGVDLEFAKLRLAALGLLTTRLPGGRPGFSLLVVINARFPQPVPLGFGFNLAGVGGLLGINRAVDVARLRAGLRSGSLGALLAPGDVIGNETSLLADLEALFPATPGRFVFGPTARITWGSPAIVTADLGLALELPAPVRLVVAGRVRVLLPDERAPVVRINLDALGVLDFGAGTLAVDAVLYDSQVAGWQLTGDMAVRARWSGGGDFALSAGGFHPRYRPPAHFPALRRLALAIGGDGAVRARFASYFALTPNTLQFGGRAEVHAAAAGFTAAGGFDFDALVQFDPFGFEVDVALTFAIRWHGRMLLGVAADLYLRGPGEWHVRGHAVVRLLFIKASVRFDGRFGGRADLPAAAAVHVAQKVRAALGEDAAWLVEEREGTLPAVTLAPRPGAAGRLVSPAARVVVRQKVAPLAIRLDRFGGSPVDGDRVLRIDSATLGGKAMATTEVRDAFAASQYQDLSDEEKLARASFDLMPSGVEFTATGEVSVAGGARSVPVGYRTVVVDAPDTPARPLATAGPPVVDWVLDGATLARLAPAGAAGRSPVRTTGDARFTGPGIDLSVAEESFAVVDAGALTPAGPRPPAGARWSRSEAAQALRDHTPPPGGQPVALMVLPAVEAADREGVALR